MLQLSPIPLVPSSTPLSPADFAGIDYIPALLLSSGLDREIVTDDEYQRAAASGFNDYFEQMYTDDEYEVFIPHLHTRPELIQYIINNMVSEDVCTHTPLAWSIGFIIGWLSALALSSPELANSGLQFLSRMIEYRQRYQQEYQTNTPLLHIA